MSEKERARIPPLIVTSASQAAAGIVTSLLELLAGQALDSLKPNVRDYVGRMDALAAFVSTAKLGDIPDAVKGIVSEDYQTLIDALKAGIGQGVGGTHASLADGLWGTSGLVQAYKGSQIETGVLPFLTRLWNVQYQPSLPDETTLARMHRLDLIDRDFYVKHMGYIGWSEDFSNKIFGSVLRPIDVERATELYWRGVYTKETYEVILKMNMIRDDDIGAFLELTKLIPPAPDLITMVVREAFDPRYVVPAPDIFAEYMAKKGYSKEWADRYWTMHFVRAPIDRMEERYRRGVLTEAELRAWYIIADIHPGDHDDLLGTIYSAPTRLDMRQGYAAGVYTHDDLVRFSRWRRLSPEDAEMAARSIELYLLRDEVTKMAAMAETDFVDDIIDEATLRSDLGALRLTPEEIEYRVQLAIHKKDVRLRRIKPAVSIDVLKDEITRMASAAEQDLVDDLIDEWTFRADLEAMGFTVAEIEYREALAGHKRETELRRLAVNAAKTNFLYGKLTVDEFRQEMLSLGISAIRTELIIRELAPRRHQTEIEIKPEKKKRLTEAKVATARDLGLISDPEYVRRLIEMDYTPEDAQLLLSVELTPRPVTAEELARRRRTVEARLNRARRRYELQLTRTSLDIEAVEQERVDLEAIAAESLDIFNTQISILEREITEFSPGEIFMKLYGRLLTAYDITVIGYESITRRIFEEIFLKPELVALIPDAVRTRLNNWKILRERREFAAASYDKRLKALVTKKTQLGEMLVLVEKQRDEEISEYEEEMKLIGGIAS